LKFTKLLKYKRNYSVQNNDTDLQSSRSVYLFICILVVRFLQCYNSVCEQLNSFPVTPLMREQLLYSTIPSLAWRNWKIFNKQAAFSSWKQNSVLISAKTGISLNLELMLFTVKSSSWLVILTIYRKLTVVFEHGLRAG